MPVVGADSFGMLKVNRPRKPLKVSSEQDYQSLSFLRGNGSRNKLLPIPAALSPVTRFAARHQVAKLMTKAAELRVFYEPN
jgi:hypothetical protein